MLFGNNARSCEFSELGPTLNQPEKSHIRETLNLLMCADSSKGTNKSEEVKNL